MTVFSATYACILNDCYDGNMRTYAFDKTIENEVIHNKLSRYKSSNCHASDHCVVN